MTSPSRLSAHYFSVQWPIVVLLSYLPFLPTLVPLTFPLWKEVLFGPYPSGVRGLAVVPTMALVFCSGWEEGLFWC